MCGIAIITGGEPSERKSRLGAMLSMMHHRGPDGEGEWHNDQISIGHRRLSIIDPVETSNQPMVSTNGRFVITFNGEIYNYKALRDELKSYQFKTQSDTEVLLAGFEQWGIDVARKAHGMFVFAVYDSVAHKLFVFRDRIGIKPVYYTNHDGNISICSEIRPIVKHCIRDPKLDETMLVDFMRFQTVKPPGTLVKGIKMIRAGHYLEIDGSNFEEKSYWEIDKIEKRDFADDLKQDIRNLLVQSVEERLISDVPLGSFLSGGVDSSVIVASATKILGRDLSTYSIVFDEDKFDESRFSNMVASACRTDHHEIKLTSQTLLQELPEALFAMDHPSGDGINTYMISEAAKKEGITVCLSGLGADELFYGYNIFSYAQKLMSPAIINVGSLVRVPLEVMNKINPTSQRIKLAEILKHPYRNVSELYPMLRKLYSEKELTALGLTPGTITGGEKSIAIDWIAELSIDDIKGYMEPVLLRDADQMGMAHSLEIRVPFLDHRLVEYVLGVPDKMKDINAPKRILIDAFSDLIPNEIWQRPKMGFTFPWEIWLKNELKSFVETNLQYLKGSNYFNAASIDDIWQRFISGDKRIGWAKVWILVVLGNWMKANGIR